MKLVMGNCYGIMAQEDKQQDYAGQTQKLQQKSGVSCKKTKSQALR
jgi:hypothetical protein